jgi:hypothetical protein
LPKGLKETIYNAGKRQVSVKGQGLGGKTLYTKEHTKANTSNKGEKDLKRHIG